MAGRPDKNKTQSPNAAPAAAGERPLTAEVERIREQIAGRHSKAALQMAKDLHKRCGTAESESLLVEAYQARIDDLLKQGMSVEAKALMGIVKERFPATAQRLADQQREISALDGRLDEVVAPLGDPKTSPEVRARIEPFIRQRIHDLPALAAVSSLPPEHSLRVAAGALAAAFEAVTRGPVDDAQLVLPEVARRSPLAPWKALVCAIASYYRREDEECRKWLKAIADDSLPCRLVPPFMAMLGIKTANKFGSAEEKLIAAAGDRGAALRPALAALEAAFEAKKQRAVLDAARAVAAASSRSDASLRDRLRQHIAVRGIMQHIPPSSMNAAMGGAARQDAYYYRLLARTLEDRSYDEGYAEAAIVWADFRPAAIDENWFAAGSLEDGVLSLHMAQLIEKVPADLFAEMTYREASYRKPGKRERAAGLPSAGELYERACAADPDPETFRMWLHCAEKDDAWQAADNVAEQWRKARPGDIHPLLHLMESAEKRNAFKKSLKYLEEAEVLDRLNPEVRRAKLRLLLSAVLRHLSQRKTHLARNGIEQLETVPEVRPGEVAALATALRWCVAGMDGDDAEVRKREAELNGSLGQAATSLLLMALMTEAKMSVPSAPPLLKFTKSEALEVLTGAVKACVLGEGIGLRIQLPPGWNKTLMAALHLPNCPVDAAQMLALGEAALASAAPELAFTVSSVGLAGGRANARFLFLRARALPRFALLRRNGCFTAALELARRERNTELAGKILDQLNGKQQGGRGGWEFGGNPDPQIASRPVPPELLGKILEEEKELVQFPICEGYREPKYADEFESSRCDCPRCRAKRGEAVGGMEFADDDEDEFDDDEEFGDDEDEFDESMPPLSQKLTKMLVSFLDTLPPGIAQKVKTALAAGEDPITAIDRILKSERLKTNSSAPSGIERKARVAKAPPPEQGNLF